MKLTQHTDTTLNNLPQDLSRLTKKQINALLAFYSSMTLPELRQRQALAQEQKGLAYAMIQKNQGYNVEMTYNNLDITEKLLFTVIFDGNYRK